MILPALPMPALVATAAVVVLLAVLAGGVLVRRRRCARLCERFSAAATAGRFAEADALAGRWFGASRWTGLRRRVELRPWIARLRPRRSRIRPGSPSRPVTRRPWVS